MKILICTDTFYPGVGGTEAACCGFASELAKANEAGGGMRSFSLAQVMGN